jgi:hypothetical protein
MQWNKHLPAIFIMLLASSPAAAQLAPAEPDPLARIRDAAAANVQACSATGETLCEQVAPKIIANAQGDSPLPENLRKLRAALATNDTSVAEERAVAWAVAAFRDAGLDAQVEKFSNPDGNGGEVQAVAVEYRGREKPDEWVLVGAHLPSRSPSIAAIDGSCDAAALMEAVRDISATAMHPKRSIRFVLFTGGEHGMSGGWAYARGHRAELDSTRAAIFFHSACYRVSGYLLNGRPELEAGMRDAMKPIESLGATHFAISTTPGTDDFDFLLEGVPTVSAYPVLLPVRVDGSMPAPENGKKTGLDDVKHNVAVVAVTAFGVADRTESIGERQSRAEIETLLETLGVDAQMKTMGTWSDWESGERGRELNGQLR